MRGRPQKHSTNPSQLRTVREGQAVMAGPVRMPHERRAVVESSVVGTYIKELLEELPNASFQLATPFEVSLS